VREGRDVAERKRSRVRRLLIGLASALVVLVASSALLAGCGTPSVLTRHESLSVAPESPPDGRQIAFVRGNCDTRCEIHVMRADGTAARPLTKHGSNLFPSWSPDGTKIAFTHESAGTVVPRFDVDVINLDGTNQRDLTADGRGNSVEPVWSPDGGAIAFTFYAPGVTRSFHS
jgi:Tol biopolymer transport system component